MGLCSSGAIRLFHYNRDMGQGEPDVFAPAEQYVYSPQIITISHSSGVLCLKIVQTLVMREVNNMLRDLLSSRWFQGGFAFFVLCVGGSLLYSWHV